MTKLKNDHELGKLMETAHKTGREKGASIKEIEEVRASAIAATYGKMDRIGRRLLTRDKFAIADPLKNFGEKGAMELIQAIGALLAQNWGPQDREQVRKLEEYIVRRRGRENMRRAKGE